MITEASHLWLKLHRHYRGHHLPFAGGLMQQPNKYIEAMEALSSAFNAIERDQIEQMRDE